MNKFEHVSPSQIDDYLTCHRLWWFTRILGIKKPDSASTQQGTEVHAVLEEYLETGKKPDPSTKAGAIAEPGLVHLPPPGTVLVETNMDEHRDIVRLQLAGIDVTGRIDVVNLAGNEPEVLDHKTTSDMKYAKTAKDLAENPQMNMYAKFLRHWLEARKVAAPTEVRVTHVVYLTKGKPKSKRTSTVLTNQHVDEQWAYLESVVEQMRVDAVKTTPTEVDPNESSCFKYGGCYFRSRCSTLRCGSQFRLDDVFGSDETYDPAIVRSGANPEVVFESASQPEKKESPMNIIEQLKQRRAEEAKAAAGGSSTAAPAASAAAQTPKPDVSRLGVSAAAVSAAISTVAAGVLPPDASRPEKDEDLNPSDTAAGTAQASSDSGGETKTVRRPKQYKDRLKVLGWPDSAIERMSPASMHYVLDKTLGPAAAHLDDEGNVAGTPAPVTSTSTTTSTAPKVSNELQEKVNYLLTLVINKTDVFASSDLRDTFSDTHAVNTAGWAEVLAAGQAQKLWKFDPEAKTVQWTPPPPPPPVVKAPPSTAQGSASSEGLEGMVFPKNTDKEWDVSAPPVRSAVPASVAAHPALPGLVLFVDCLPEKGFYASNFVMLEDVMAPLYDRAAADLKVPHYAVAGYQEGAKTAAMYVAVNVDKIVERWPTLVINSRMGAAQHVLEILIPKAVLVIRGR